MAKGEKSYMREQSLQALNSQNREELWATRIQQCRESGQGVKAWCAEQGLSYHTYYKWQQKLFRKYSETVDGFYEISSGSIGGKVAATVQVGMYRADIYAGADEQTVFHVLKALKSC